MNRSTLQQIKHEWPATCTIPKVADALGISPSYAYELAKSDGLPFKTFKLGGRRLVRTADLIRFLEDGDPTPGMANSGG
ncbi:MAG: helix-turn-helix domain-containing protein [Actinocrinis sp.]